MQKTATIHAQQRWEYCELTRKTVAYLVRELNDIGHQGWELISVLYAKDPKGEMAWTGVLKRPYVPGASAPKKEVVDEANLHRPVRIEPAVGKPAADASEFELEEPEPPAEKPEPQLPLRPEPT